VALLARQRKVADDEVLCNPNAAPTQAEIRLWRLQVRTRKVIYLRSVFLVFTASLKGAERGYFGFYTEAYLPVIYDAQECCHVHQVIWVFFTYHTGLLCVTAVHASPSP
jgi:hypothetical protein